jgi:hypothetical protein
MYVNCGNINQYSPPQPLSDIPYRNISSGEGQKL